MPTAKKPSHQLEEKDLSFGSSGTTEEPDQVDITTGSEGYPVVAPASTGSTDTTSN